MVTTNLSQVVIALTLTWLHDTEHKTKNNEIGPPGEEFVKSVSFPRTYSLVNVSEPVAFLQDLGAPSFCARSDLEGAFHVT